MIATKQTTKLKTLQFLDLNEKGGKTDEHNYR